MARRALSLVTICVLASAVAVVTAIPAGATTVTTEAELRAAFANDAVVDLAGDITLTDCAAGFDGAVLRAVTNTTPTRGLLTLT